MRWPLLFVLQLLLVVPFFAASANAWGGGGTKVLDAVGIQQSRRDLYAFRDGTPTTRLRLEPHEEVTWLGAQGRVGIVLTNKRVLGVTRRYGWREYRLHREDGAPFAQLGGRVALVVTTRRVLSLDSASGSLSVERLGAGEHLVTSGARDDVAVAVTNRRAIGFSGGRSFSSETQIRAQERFYGLRMLGSAGTIETSRRFLVFSAATGGWMDERRSLR